jgi:ribosomal protein S18 acetylase RimI-like enzyme
MEYRCQKLSSEKVLSLLRQAENSFAPPLSHNIPYTLHEYANKLSENAMFVVCIDDDEIIGFTAYYINTEGRYVYIPQIWVSDQYQRRGIGSLMVDNMIESLPNTIESIRLEVRKNNEKAYSFYLKCMYSVIELKNGKYLMEKKI